MENMSSSSIRKNAMEILKEWEKKIKELEEKDDNKKETNIEETKSIEKGSN